MPPDPNDAWRFLWIGYLFTVAVETPILLAGLARCHRLHDRLMAALWLNACTYPIVILVLPYWVWVPYGRGVYLAIAETFAPLAECMLLWLASDIPKERFARTICQDFVVIAMANLASFAMGAWWF